MAIQRLPLVGPLTERSAAAGKDQRFVNCFPENMGKKDSENEDDLYIVKRPGLALHNDDNPATDTARGIFSWRGDLYTVWANKVHKNGTALTLGDSTLNLSTGRVYFDETGGSSSELLVQEQHTSTAAITKIASDGTMTDLNEDDVDIPDIQVPGIVVLDTYTVVMDRNAVIYNSNVGNEAVWSATDILNAEVKGDRGVALARHHNYLAAFGEKTAEFFYDNANPSGSPFRRLEGTLILVGCPAGETVVNVEGELLAVLENNDGGRFVAKFKGFTATPISGKTVDESLDNEQENITNAYAYSLRIMGHSFYILTLPTTAQKTWVYDLTEDMWHEWTHKEGAGAETFFIGYGATIHNGDVLIQGRNNGLVYRLDPGVFQDYSGNAINLLFQTNKFDGGVHHNKFLHRLTVIGDRQTAASAISLSYSDDDYQTFSTARSIDMNNRTPGLTRLGYFRRRAFKGTHTANTPLRIQALEMNLRQGHYGF